MLEGHHLYHTFAEMPFSSRRIQPHLQLIHSLSETPEPLEQLSDGGEAAVLAERPHAEDLGFGDLFDPQTRYFSTNSSSIPLALPLKRPRKS